MEWLLLLLSQRISFGRSEGSNQCLRVTAAITTTNWPGMSLFSNQPPPASPPEKPKSVAPDTWID